MPYLTDLADACRKSGLKVVEVSGWRTRGHGSMTAVETIVCHHTATPKTAAGNYPTLRVVRDGLPGLPGPLSQLGLGRDGTVYVIAAGVSYHAGTVGLRSWDNWHAIGIEAEADGASAWPASQMDAYARLCRALCDHYNLGPDQVLGHKEVARPLGRKIDPNFDMDDFREAVAAQGDDMPLTDEDIARIAAAVRKELHGGDQSRFQRLRTRVLDTAAAARKRDRALADRLDEIATSEDEGVDASPRS